jgi:HAMP domain-containing protein
MSRLNIRIDSFLTSAATEPRSLHFPSDSDATLCASLEPEFTAMRDRAEHISAEIAERSTGFTESIDGQKLAFKSECDELAAQFRVSAAAQTEKHTAEMSALQAKLNELNSSFDSRVSAEIGRYSEEIGRLETEFNRLNGYWSASRETLEASLAKWESEVQRLTDTLEKMEADNAAFLVRMERQFQDDAARSEREFHEKMERLTTENRDLKAQLVRFRGDDSGSLDKLREELARLTALNQVDITAEGRAKQAELDEQIKQMIGSNQEAEKDIRERLARTRREDGVKTGALEARQADLHTQLEASDSRMAERLKVVELRCQHAIQDLDKRSRKLAADQKLVLDDVMKKYLIELKTKQKRSVEALGMINHRLEQVQQTFDEERKQLEGEITALIRERGRLQAQLKQAPGSTETSWHALDFAKGDTVAFPPDEGRIDSIRSVRAIIARFQQHDDAVKKALEDAQDRKQKFDSELRGERQRLIVRLERDKKAVTALENDVRMLRIRKDELISAQRISEAQRRAARKKNEAELQSQIALQRDAVQQFQEEIQKLRIKETDRKLLAPLLSQHRNEVSDLQAKVDSVEETAPTVLADRAKEYDALLAQDREKSKSLVTKAFETLDEVLHNVAVLKGQVEHAAGKEQSKWQNVRKDLAESNAKMANALVQKNSRPTSPGISRSTSPQIARTTSPGIARTTSPGIARTTSPGIGRTPSFPKLGRR